MQPTEEEKDNAKPKNLAFWKIVLTPIILLLVAVCSLGLHSIAFAGICTALAIYLAATRTVPCLLVKVCPYCIAHSRYSQAVSFANFGITWCKLLKIEAIGTLPRSLSWDTLLKSHLAQALLLQGRFEECVAVNLEVLSLLEAERDFMGAAKISGKLAFCYTQQGKISKATALMERVVPVLETAANNADSTNDKLAVAYRARLCSALFEQATLLENKRDFISAESVRRKAAAMSMKVEQDPDHIRSMGHLSMLGKLLIRLEKYDEAEKLLNQVLEVRTRRLHSDSLLIASVRQGLGRLYCATDRLPQAEKVLIEGLRTIEKIGDGKHPDLPDYRSALAKLRLKQGKNAEAETLLLAAIKQKEEQGAKDHPGIIDYLLDLAALKETVGDTTSAQSLRQRVDKIIADMA